MPDDTPVETRTEDGGPRDPAVTTPQPSPRARADTERAALPAPDLTMRPDPASPAAGNGRPPEGAGRPAAAPPSSADASSAGSSATGPVAGALSAGFSSADASSAGSSATDPAAGASPAGGSSATGPGAGALSAGSSPADASSADAFSAGSAAAGGTEAGRGRDDSAGPRKGGAATSASGAGRSSKNGGTKGRGSFLRELPVLLVIAFGLALLIKTFLVQAFFIPSGSMEQTLHGCPGCSGDRVLVNKLGYRFGEPRPGDIVVFRGPESWAPEARFDEPSNVVQRVLRTIGGAIGVAPPGEKDFIKRVIAVGGQTVQCCDAQGRVSVDGRALDEPYVYTGDSLDYQPMPFGPVTVPPGRLWMMGDHRDQSADSRVHIADSDHGTISVDDVVGKAFVIVWPPSRWDTLGTPSAFTTAAPLSGAVALGTPALLGLGAAVPVVAARRRRRRGR